MADSKVFPIRANLAIYRRTLYEHLEMSILRIESFKLNVNKKTRATPVGGPIIKNKIPYNPASPKGEQVDVGSPPTGWYNANSCYK